MSIRSIPGHYEPDSKEASQQMEVVNGVFKVEVPTPFPVGRVNAYIIEGDPVTLVDSGPNSEKAFSGLLQGFEQAGVDIARLSQVLLTHGHTDHVGLVSSIGDEVEQRGGKRPSVWLHQNDHHRVIRHEEYTRKRVRSYIEIAERAGTPCEILDQMPYEWLVDRFISFGKSIPDVQTLTDETVFETGLGPLRCIWTPGHSHGSVCFVAEEERIIFSGDHLLSDISSNPSLDFDRSSDIMMLRYLDSLLRLDKYKDYQAYPGHRAIINNIGSRIRELEEDVIEKLDRMREALAQTHQSIYALSRQIYGSYGLDQIVLALAETMDLVRILEANQQAETVEIEGVLHARERLSK